MESEHKATLTAALWPVQPLGYLCIGQVSAALSNPSSSDGVFGINCRLHFLGSCVEVGFVRDAFQVCQSDWQAPKDVITFLEQSCCLCHCGMA